MTAPTVATPQPNTGPRLAHSHLTMLAHLYEAGGYGDLDIHDRVMAGPARRVIVGHTGGWLRLVRAGYVAGDGQYIVLTEEGRERAAAMVASRTRSGDRF